MPPRARPASLLALVMVLLCAAVLAPSAASATAAPAYEASAASTAKETWTFKGAGAPKPCRSWTQASGTVSVRVFAKGGFRITRIPGLGTTGGLTDPQDPRMNIKRQVDYRIHQVGTTPDCTPCGPSSEFGTCGDAIPDLVGAPGCEPAAAPGGTVLATISGSTLVTKAVAPSASILRRCSSLVPAGVPVGSPEPKLVPMRFPGALRRIQRLKVGESAKFDRAVDRGPDCKRPSGELRTCTRHRTGVTVTRTR
ncbi:hypothetical protein AB0L40_05415 [Patulibacter sp. NPDC049589]|uniref:hypothetical protein n=1 Tax=Patulibacter sp. NPDC049589 TaxID=3154731 RepID=UPI0034163610